MRKILLLVICLLSFILNESSYAENNDSLNQSQSFFSSFNKGGYASLIFNQITFMNWVKGGENSVSATGLLNLFANLNKEKFIWENAVDLKFGLQNNEESGLRTNQDAMDLITKFGYKALAQFYYSGLVNFKSQFANGFNFPNDSVVVSKFFSPAYLILSLGVDFKPNENLSLYLSPMTGKFIFIGDKKIANAGTYTSEPALFDSTGKIIKDGGELKSDFGAYLRINYKATLLENITLVSKFDIFNNFTDKSIKNRRNFDIDCETSIVMKVNELISANFLLHLIYDNDTNIPIFEKVNGQKKQIGLGPRLQLKEVLGIGISYYFK